MPPKVPPPPRPDPVTLDQVYNQLTSTDVSFDSKAYNVMALNTIAFHPSVKLFLFEEPPLASNGGASSNEATGTNSTTATDALSKTRREKLIKSIAFMLAQRNNAICHECRWETVSLLGELCRMDQTHKGAPTSAPAILEAKLNTYAKANLEFLAQLPWFVPAINTIIKAGGGPVDEESDKEGATVRGSSTNGNRNDSQKSTVDREALRAKLHAARQGKTSSAAADTAESVEEDEDVVIALLDIRRALPHYVKPSSADETPVFEWRAENLEQARDLMFVDASTSMLHLIPTVSRGNSDVCAQCQKRVTLTATTPNPFLRCSSCKAAYYCSPACQKAHWATVHRTPCRAYKERCDTILEQYYAANSVSAKKKKKELKTGEVVILEVPLEPSLFYETRRHLYDHRDESFANVDFSDYFMKYNVKGT